MNQIEGNLKLENFIGKFDYRKEEIYDQFPNVVVKKSDFPIKLFSQTSNSMSDLFCLVSLECN